MSVFKSKTVLVFVSSFVIVVSLLGYWKTCDARGNPLEARPDDATIDPPRRAISLRRIKDCTRKRRERQLPRCWQIA